MTRLSGGECCNSKIDCILRCVIEDDDSLSGGECLNPTIREWVETPTKRAKHKQARRHARSKHVDVSKQARRHMKGVVCQAN